MLDSLGTLSSVEWMNVWYSGINFENRLLSIVSC